MIKFWLRKQVNKNNELKTCLYSRELWFIRKSSNWIGLLKKDLKIFFNGVCKGDFVEFRMKS